MAQVTSQLRTFKRFQEKVEDLYPDPEPADVGRPLQEVDCRKGVFGCYLSLAWSSFFLHALLLYGK